MVSVTSDHLALRVGLEPTTYGLTDRRSTYWTNGEYRDIYISYNAFLSDFSYSRIGSTLTVLAKPYAITSSTKQ